MSNGWTSHGTLVTPLDASGVRNVFTTAFLCLNFAISFLGSRLLTRRVQRKLVRRNKNGWHTVPVNQMTPWLSLGDMASYVWQVRRIPGGMYGMVMLWTGVFSLAHQYFVNSFILPQQLYEWCLFEQGMNTTYTNASIIPMPTWPAARLVSSALLAVQLNGGSLGIYDKINNSTTAFSPQMSDVLGYWNCTQLDDGTISPADWDTFSKLSTYLQEQGFMYTNASHIAGSVIAETGVVNGFVAWSASVDNDVEEQWDLRATIANPLYGNASLPTSNFQCELVSLTEHWKPPLMPSNRSLTEWGQTMLGSVKETDAEWYQYELETVLNSMSMIAGSGNVMSLKLSQGAKNPWYGCVTGGTLIQAEVFVMLFALAFLFLLVLAAYLYGFCRYRLSRYHTRVHEVPTDLVGLQVALVRSTTGHKNITPRKLSGCTYGWRAETNEMTFKDESSKDTQSPLLPAAAPNPSAEKQQSISVHEVPN